MIQWVRRGRVRERGRFRDKGSEALPSGSVRDHRVERLAGPPCADQRRPQLGECPERLADRGRLVAELRLAGARGFTIRPADDPVVGLHHGVGDERLPLDGADPENREAAVVRELAEPVGEVALPLPAQPRDPMWRDVAEEAFRNREAPEMLEAVQQPVGVGRIAARLELPEPHEPCHAGVDRLFEQMLEVAPQPGRHPLGDAGLDAAFRVDERIGAEPLDRRRSRQDGPRAPAGLDEPPDQVLVRLRLRRFFVEPLDELTRRAAREGPESVQAAQLRQMLVPGLGPHRVVAELLPVQVELAADEVHDRRGNELARGQQSARVAEDAQLQREAQLVAGTPPEPDVERRRARRLEARPPRPQPRPSGQHRAGPVGPSASSRRSPSSSGS